MASLVYSMSVSLDGFVETRGHSLEWVIVDEELHRHFNDEARGQAAFLYGRGLYEAMAPYWPTADEDAALPDYVREFAGIWRETPKVVFSSSLDHVGWNSRLVRGAAGPEIARLKSEIPGELSVGGAHLAWSAIRLGLVDEFRLLVHPVVLGDGTPFFPDDVRLDLRLEESRALGSGAVLLRYRPS
jgi:dihydrofolate reductase